VSNTNPTQSSPVTDHTRWFAEEVHPHDAALKAFLRGRFPKERDVEDVVQESYVRIWKARAGDPIRSIKAFLFRVAQNVALDRIRQNRAIVEISVGDLPGYDVIDERSNVAETINAHEMERLLADALSTLPARAHDVVILCKINGLSHREAAAQLDIAEKTVDEHLRRGLKRLGEELRRRGLHSLYET
jgi:RNA polymerase sigma factor (sigma-70 family)